jgi:glycosyltransferase involved in cell wall biosynthesis
MPSTLRNWPMPDKRLRILTWHVHGNYLYYLTQVPHEFYLVTDAERSTHHAGKVGRLPFGDNVHEAPVEHIPQMAFDVVLYQSRAAYEEEQHRLLSDAQRRLPRIYLEHDPPQEHPTNTAHWVDDPNTLLVHVTHFNALMWDSRGTPTRVIEHGVLPLTDDRYRGERDAGLVVVNNLDRRGRRLGADVYAVVKQALPLTLVGMGAERLGGAGEAPHDVLPGLMASHRFFFNPIRYTSLGLAVVEAMMVGMPIIGLATTELPTVIRNGESGFVDTRVDRLVDAMRELLRNRGEAARLGEGARRVALERFNIARFVADWLDALRTVTR